MTVARRIESFARDEDGAMVVQLDCGHRRHIRHRPPLSFYPWIDDDRLRAERIGSAIECERCARLELPDDVESYEQTAVFDATTLPAELRKNHATRRGVWARVVVHEGELQLVHAEPIATAVDLRVGRVGIIAPELPHALRSNGPFQLHIEFLRRPVQPR